MHVTSYTYESIHARVRKSTRRSPVVRKNLAVREQFVNKGSWKKKKKKVRENSKACEGLFDTGR